MIRYIKIAPHEPRCRSQTPSGGGMHNDCGRRHECARALGATGSGAPVKDLSVDAAPYCGVMYCRHFLSIEDAEKGATAGAVKQWVSVDERTP